LDRPPDGDLINMNQATPVNITLRRIVLGALLFSGIAGIINQVVWQRALKIFLGGSETISALVVVLVFMLGLGIGSGAVAHRVRSLANPLRAFGYVEIGLFVVNMIIAILLSLDLDQSIYAAERLAVSAGIPIRLVYATGALCLLLPPTLLMGTTLPLASDACQRQLGATRSSLITSLFTLNTVGACIGAAAGSFYLMPYYGQRTSLIVAAGFNLLAGLVILLASRREKKNFAREAPDIVQKPVVRRSLSREEALGAVLGFLALGYEMYLLRVVALAHQPLPYTFAFTLCFYLLFWSVGVWAAGRFRERLRTTLVAGAVLIAVMPLFYAFDRYSADFSLFSVGLVYFVPCICFGLLYGALVSRSASEWGRDVGRFYAFNTLGSCCGILFFSLAGYEIPHHYNAFIIALGLVGILLHLMSSDEKTGRTTKLINSVRLGQAVIGLTIAGFFVTGLTAPYSENEKTRTFWGRDGVVEVFDDGNVWIDGLWHSHLSVDQSHIGGFYSWMMAAAAILVHQEGPIEDALIVGNGIGITAATLAKMNGLNVDTYEINHTLRRVLKTYPEGTLYVDSNPKIDIRWQDGRSGMALDSKQYDLIISAPLYLRQAGSSILLSREYMLLAKRRLKEGGVFALYSREGALAQAALVNATVRSVFSHSQTLLDGLLTVASDTPIHISREGIAERLKADDPLILEMARFDRLMQQKQMDGLYGAFDIGGISYQSTRYLITDDHPLVEYPLLAERLLRLSD
jgi:spermidine synthase